MMMEGLIGSMVKGNARCHTIVLGGTKEPETTHTRNVGQRRTKPVGGIVVEASLGNNDVSTEVHVLTLMGAADASQDQVSAP